MLTLEHKGPPDSTSPDPLSNNKFRPLTCTQTGGLVCDEPFCEVISVSLHMSVITQDGESALMKAVRKGMTEVVSLLLKAGANIDLQNKVHVSVRLTKAVSTIPIRYNILLKGEC